MWKCPECHYEITALRYRAPAVEHGYRELREPDNITVHQNQILGEAERDDVQLIDDGEEEQYFCTECDERISMRFLIWQDENGTEEILDNIQSRNITRNRTRGPERTERFIRINENEENETIIPYNAIDESPRKIEQIEIKCQNKRCQKNFIYLEEGDFAECPKCGFNNDLKLHRKQIKKQPY